MMGYKRLTKRDKFGVIALCNACPRKGTERCTAEETDGMCCINEQQNRLAELEDKIEQGYIRILPVNAGDKIYVVPSKVNFDLNKLNGYSEHNRVYEQTVDEIRFFRKDIYMVFSCDYLENHRGASLGETWFLTREEAEKRLKELQG